MGKHHLFNIAFFPRLRQGARLFSSGQRERNRILCINSVRVMMWSSDVKFIMTSVCVMHHHKEIYVYLFAEAAACLI